MDDLFLAQSLFVATAARSRAPEDFMGL